MSLNNLIEKEIGIAKALETCTDYGISKNSLKKWLYDGVKPRGISLAKLSKMLPDDLLYSTLLNSCNLFVFDATKKKRRGKKDWSKVFTRKLIEQKTKEFLARGGKIRKVGVEAEHYRQINKAPSKCIDKLMG